MHAASRRAAPRTSRPANASAAAAGARAQDGASARGNESVWRARWRWREGGDGRVRVATGDIVDVHVSAERELEQLCTLQTSTACADEHASEPATGVSCSRPVVATIAVERGRARTRGRGRWQDPAGGGGRGGGGGDGGGREATPADTTDAATPAATAAGRTSNALHVDKEIRTLKEQVFQVEQLAQPKERNDEAAALAQAQAEVMRLTAIIAHARNTLNSKQSENEMYYDRDQEILCLRTKLEATERKLEAAETKIEITERKLEASQAAERKFEASLAALKRELMRQHVIPWEDDDDGSRLPGQWVNVRLFLSSSFVDTQAERDMIVRKILPKLNFDLQEFFVRVTAVDLRWGVLSHEAENCKAIQQTCLNELDKCIETSPTSLHPCPGYPFFVCLRTARCGWVQDAYNNPEDFEKPERFDWITCADLRQMPLSITELEIYHGCLGRRENNNGHRRAFFYFRKDEEYISKVDPDMRWLFEFEHITEEEARARNLSDAVKKQYTISKDAARIRHTRQHVDNQIHQRSLDPVGPALVRHYAPSDATTRVTGEMGNGKKFGVGYVTVPQALEQQIFLDLFEAVTRQYPKPYRSLNAFALEDVYHKNHLESSKFCFGRERLISELMGFTDHSADVRHPMAVVGLPGSGKSTVMAHLIKELLKHDEFVLFYHVVASSPQSFSIKNLLSRLCVSLKKQCELSLELPASMEALRESWMHFVLMAAQKYKPVVIVLDAINQLSPEHGALDLAWLPYSLPKDPCVRIFCSMIKDDPLHNLLGRRSSQSSTKQIVPWQVEVNPMQPGDSQTLVGSFLRQYHKSLTLQQMSVLLAKEDSGSPLYLITACSSLLNFGIYEEMDKELDKLPTRKIPLLSAMIQSLRELFGAEVVRSTLLLVYFSQGGIFEHELQHLVNKEVERIGVDVAKNGDFSFSLLYQRLQSLLPTSSSGLLHFFHNDMRTLIFEEFLDGRACNGSHLAEGNQQKQFELQTAEEKKESLRCNRLLAEFYLEQVQKQGNYELRTIQALTMHLSRANMMVELRDLLLLPLVFKAMFSSELRSTFLTLWSVVLSSAVVGVESTFQAVDAHNSSVVELAEWYRESLSENEIDDPMEEAKVYCQLGDFFSLTEQEAQGLALSRDSAASFYSNALLLNPKETSALVGLSKLECSRGEMDKATEHLRQAMVYLQTIHGYKHIEVARCQREMAHLFYLQGDGASAKQAISKARKIVAETCGKTSLEYADFLKSEAGLLRDLAKQGTNAAVRVLLSCPVAHTDAAKALEPPLHRSGAKGANWDAGLKKWYIEAGTPLAPYAAWLPADAKSALQGNDQKQAKLSRDSAAAYREAVEKQKQLVGERHPILLATYDEYMALILEQQKVLLVEDVVDEVATPRVLLEMCINGTLQGKRAFDLLEALEALNTMSRSQTEDTMDPSQVQARVLKRWKKEMQVLMMKSGVASLLIGDPEQRFFLFGDATAGLDTLDARKERQVHGRTALMWASAMGISSVVPTLLRLGDNPELVDEDKKTALMIAIENKHEEVVQLLITPTAAAGAINAQDAEGNSALMLATSGCQSTIMGKLLEVGATVSSVVLIAMIKPETAALALNLIQDEILKIDHNVATLVNENLSQNHRPIELLMASDDDTCIKFVKILTSAVSDHIPGFELQVCMYGLNWKNRPFMWVSDNEYVGDRAVHSVSTVSEYWAPRTESSTKYYRKTIIESSNVLKQNGQPTGHGRWVEENLFAMRNYGSGTWIARFSDQVVLTGWLPGQLSDDQVRDCVLVAREEWMEEEVDLTKDLPDSAFSSSGHSDENNAPHCARLNGPKCWCPKRQGGSGQWLQIDMGSAVVVYAFAVQGHFFNWVSTLKFAVSVTGGGGESEWESLGSFEANSDADSVVRAELLNPVRVRFVRFYPLKCDGGHADFGKMRISVLGNNNVRGAAANFTDNYFTDNFSSFSGGSFNGGQYQSGLIVAFGGNLAGWSKAGFNGVHVVDRANREADVPSGSTLPCGSAKFSVMIYMSDVITQSAGVSGSNLPGTVYAVSFDAGPAVYQQAQQATSATDGILFEVLRTDNSVLATYTHLSGSWSGYPALTAGSFEYIGDGRGDVRLRISSSAPSNGRFAGCIDKVSIYGVAPSVCTECPCAPAAARMCYEMFAMPQWRTRPESKITFGVPYDRPPTASTALTLNYWAQYDGTGSGGGRWCGWVVPIPTGKFARMSCYVKLAKLLSNWGEDRREFSDGSGGLSWGFKFQNTFRNEFTIHHSTVNILTANTWMYISATAPTTLNGDRNHFLLIFDLIPEPITIQFGGLALEIFESQADADAAPLPYGPPDTVRKCMPIPAGWSR